MSVTWSRLDAGTGRVERIECYPSREAAVADMALMAWEDPGRGWVDYLTDDDGRVVAVGMYGEGMEYLVMGTDGRSVRFEMPGQYGGGAS